MVRISVELPEEVAAALDRAAAERRSTPGEELARIAARALAARRELLDRLQDGLAELSAGRAASHDVVMAELDAWVDRVEAERRSRP